MLRRIARAHGLQRVGPLIREAVLDQIGSGIARGNDDGRIVLWPPATEPKVSYADRAADPDLRSHADTPMPVLVALAPTLRSDVSEAERVRLMAQRVGLCRIEVLARLRFERASILTRDDAI